MSVNEEKDIRTLVGLAGKTIETYIKKGEKPAPPDDFEVQGRAGVFVSIKKSGRLRGCIGTLQPVTASVAEEVIENAVSAATRDPRFPPVTPDELDQIVISVDVLTSPEPIGNMSDLDPKKYGVIVRSRGKAGVLLPDLPGIDTAEEQVNIAMRKAGIGPGEPVDLFRFEVRRYF
ncbi:MAG: AmmeMemoRadiSam system protein A [Deltaproteobacteria bacterium]|nr:AmmeMemoRadiSam system protein A [Deltaproteobacteria bacterium]